MIKRHRGGGTPTGAVGPPSGQQICQADARRCAAEGRRHLRTWPGQKVLFQRDVVGVDEQVEQLHRHVLVVPSPEPAGAVDCLRLAGSVGHRIGRGHVSDALPLDEVLEHVREGAVAKIVNQACEAGRGRVSDGGWGVVPGGRRISSRACA
eukprot:scaffold13249_cov118-Isochrysis_galbana.AAC.14